MNKEYESSNIANSGRRDSRREIQEMEQIERGLEAFLQQELQNMEPARQEPSPQLFDMRESEEEREVEVIGMAERSGRRTGGRTGGRTRQRDDYIEDWDQPRKGRPGPAVRQGTQSAGNVKSNRSKKASGNRRSNESERPAGRKGQDKPRKKKRFRGLKRFAAVLVIMTAVLAGGLYLLVGNVYGRMNYKEISSVAGAPYKEDGVINILLIGNDSRENGEDGRSDAMILLSVSSKTKKIYMTSLLRDMYVDIPGHDGNRLNAAYSYGGAELLMETIEQNFDISVNRYVLVNFEAFANLVDAVGGVDLELTSAEIEYVNGYLVEYNMLTNRPQGTDNMDTSVSGMVHLNGPQALAYTRNRYIGTDFGRTERQRKVLSAVIGNLPAAVVTNPGELIDGLMPNLTTNLTREECYLLGLQAGKLLTYDIEQSSIPQPGTYHDATIRGMAVLEVDFDANKRYLQENIYGQTK